MGDVAKGIKSFKKGMKEPEQDLTESPSSQDLAESPSSKETSSEDSNSEKK